MPTPSTLPLPHLPHRGIFPAAPRCPLLLGVALPPLTLALQRLREEDLEEEMAKLGKPGVRWGILGRNLHKHGRDVFV